MENIFAGSPCRGAFLYATIHRKSAAGQVANADITAVMGNGKTALCAGARGVFQYEHK